MTTRIDQTDAQNPLVIEFCRVRGIPVSKLDRSVGEDIPRLPDGCMMLPWTVLYSEWIVSQREKMATELFAEWKKHRSKWERTPGRPLRVELLLVTATALREGIDLFPGLAQCEMSEISDAIEDELLRRLREIPDGSES